MNLSGNTIFIAGATSGIGLGLALRLHAAGNTVIVAGRRQERIDQITREHEGIEGFVLDVTDPGAVTDVAAAVTSRFPDTNVLITVSGIMYPEDVHDAGYLPVAEDTVTTNLLGTIRLIAAFTPHLAQKQRAAILTVSSGLAFVPLPITPTYNATKAAIHSFTESIRVQLADTPIEVIEIVPPAVRTALMNQEERESAMPLEDYLTETMTLLETQSGVKEILVERVKPLRLAEATGTYDQMLELLSSPH